MDSQTKITIILDYFIDHPEKNFDTSFLYSLQESIDEYGKLTPAQERAVENVITKWRIL